MCMGVYTLCTILYYYYISLCLLHVEILEGNSKILSQVLLSMVILSVESKVDLGGRVYFDSIPVVRSRTLIGIVLVFFCLMKNRSSGYESPDTLRVFILLFT